MSAIRAFVQAMQWQRELLEAAADRDGVAINAIRYGVPRDVGQRREWTRQDKNRLAWLEWRRVRPAPDSWKWMNNTPDFGRRSTRTSRLLHLFEANPDYGKATKLAFAQIRDDAMQEADQRGIYAALAPVIISAAARHVDLLDAFRQADQNGELIRSRPDIQWDDVNHAHDLAVAELRKYLPPDTLQSVMSQWHTKADWQTIFDIGATTLKRWIGEDKLHPESRGLRELRFPLSEVNEYRKKWLSSEQQVTTK